LLIKKSLTLNLPELSLKPESFDDIHFALLATFAQTAAKIDDESLEISVYQHILDIDRWSIDGLTGLAQAYEKNGDFQLAIRQYYKLLFLKDNSEEIQEKIDNLSKQINSNQPLFDKIN